jgi:nucleotide-binding universal stress UspA family protein
LRPHAGFIIANTLFAAIFVALVLSMFHDPAPHELPVGIVAPPAVAGQVEEALGSAVPGGFDLRVYHSDTAARAAITRDEVDGALIASPGHLRLLVARAGGGAPAQAMTAAFDAIAARSGQPLAVTDVVPPQGSDSMALSPFFIMLGVLVPSLATGSASALAFRRSRPAWCVAAPVVVAIGIGAAVAGIADGISGLGNFPAIAGIVALFSLAVAAPTAVLGRIWPPLVAVAVLVFMMFGIPASGGPSALAPFGPGFLRVLHSALPLGAAASAARGVIYFGGYGLAGPLWALAAWATAGVIALALVTAWRRPTLALAAHDAARPAPPQPDPPASAPDSTPGSVGLPEVAGFEGPGEPEPIAATCLVVGFDGSGPARRALSWAARLLATHPGILHVIYADRAIIDSDLSGFGHAEMEAARDREAARVAESAADVIAGSGVRYTFERRQGAPAEAIVAGARVIAAAGSGEDPVIVVGRSGHATHHILGSVPVHLLHHCPYPVLTIP